MANHSSPESCDVHREVCGEALTGDTSRRAIELRNQEIEMPTWSGKAEGNTWHGDNRKSCHDLAQSETLCMLGSNLHGSWEISTVPTEHSGRGREGISRNAAIHAVEKSDTPVVPEKQLNKGKPAEVVEERGVAKGNTKQAPSYRTQCRESGLTGLERVREAARQGKKMTFTALLHHITPELLLESFYELKQKAAAGVDGVTWREYEENVFGRVYGLHREIHTGAYRAQASRRVYIPKADGKMRPLGIAAVEDKVVQQAVVRVLSAIYEEDFLGFSYGFRRGRGQHDALDALCVGIESQGVNWILDADIQAFFDTIDHNWMMAFLGHRIADKRILRLIRNWLKAGVIEDGKRIAAERGTPQGAVISPLLSNIYLHYVQDLWAHKWRKHHAKGRGIVIRYADDSVVGFEHREDAVKYLAALRERMAKFGLVLHPDKTRLIEFGKCAGKNRQQRGEGKPETFDFLGFTHCCGKTRKGGFRILRMTVKKRMRATLKAIREKLRRKMHDPIPAVGKWLRQVVQGYFDYFAVPGNLYRLDSFRGEINRIWWQVLRRRSQRCVLTWERYHQLVKQYIPTCRNSHPYPSQRFRARTQGRSLVR